MSINKRKKYTNIHSLYSLLQYLFLSCFLLSPQHNNFYFSSSQTPPPSLALIFTNPIIPLFFLPIFSLILVAFICERLKIKDKVSILKMIELYPNDFVDV